VRLRRKITLAFFGISSLVSLLLALMLYRFIEGKLEDDLRDRLDDLAHVGSHGFDIAAYKTLTAKLGELDDNGVSAVEHSPEYKTIYDQLRMIRGAQPDLIRFVYLLAPTEDPANPKFVVDADVLDLLGKIARGEPVKPNDEGEVEISHYNKPYDVSEIPLLAKALADCARELEPDVVYDEAFGVSSLSAYHPLRGSDGVPLRDAKGRCLGVLGVDILDTDMQTALSAARGLAIKISVAMILVALLVSIFMGTLLTRSVQSLMATVKRFADKDFSARTTILSKDEVGELGRNFNTMADTIQLHSEQLEATVRQRTRELIEEKHTSERLLLNVLPLPIAERLKNGESLIVDRFDSVTVLFADIVGFTALSSRTTPEKLVTMLNELFSTFDKLAEKHGLEKIKTIGDAYMMADHSIAMAHMAIDMLAAIAAYATRTSTDLTIRIGMNSGSVVAGVIGQKKFIYDLWGDTVNIASRMESSGVPGRIHLSDVTALLLADEFELEARGPIDIKGKGQMSTSLLVGLKRADPARPS
jgi:class 3 adenylate cyclase/HAMP domain-containing protein